MQSSTSNACVSSLSPPPKLALKTASVVESSISPPSKRTTKTSFPVVVAVSPMNATMPTATSCNLPNYPREEECPQQQESAKQCDSNETELSSDDDNTTASSSSTLSSSSSTCSGYSTSLYKQRGYLTIVHPPRCRKYGYQNTSRYRPSISYQRARLYPIQETEEEHHHLMSEQKQAQQQPCSVSVSWSGRHVSAPPSMTSSAACGYGSQAELPQSATSMRQSAVSAVQQQLYQLNLGRFTSAHLPKSTNDNFRQHVAMPVAPMSRTKQVINYQNYSYDPCSVGGVRGRGDDPTAHTHHSYQDYDLGAST